MNMETHAQALEITMRTVLISVDNHTLGIQTAATVIAEAGGQPILFYLPSHLLEYPPEIERKIMLAIRDIVGDEPRFLIGFHLKELSSARALQLARAAREEFGSRAVLLAGGTYAMAMQDELPSFFDHIVVGSAEGIVPILGTTGEVLPRLIQKAPSRFIYPSFSDAYLLNEDGELVRGRRRPLAHPQYRHAHALEIMLEIGCSYACTFCEVATLRGLFGSEYRILPSEPARSIEAIRREIENSPDINYIYFFDEDFLLKSQKWIDAFAELYADIRLPFFIFATPRSVSRGENKLRALTRVGLDTVNVGVQTGSPRIARELFRRKEDRAEVIRVLESLVGLHVEGLITSPPMVDFVIMNPYETAVDMEETFELMRDMPLPFEAVMHCMSFFRGTPLYAKAIAEGVIPTGYRFQYDLHDFVARIRTNEFGFDLTKADARTWLRYGAFLGGMNGIHRIEAGKRFFGSIPEKYLHENLRRDMPVEEIVALVESLPNPMDKVSFPWEQATTH